MTTHRTWRAHTDRGLTYWEAFRVLAKRLPADRPLLVRFGSAGRYFRGDAGRTWDRAAATRYTRDEATTVAARYGADMVSIELA